METPGRLLNEFWNICFDFKSKTNQNTNYIEYISALLYLKYYKEESKLFQKIYDERENYYIHQKIDDAIYAMKQEIEDSKIFSDIQFQNIVFYRKLGERNIVSKVIETIELFSQNIKKEQMVEIYEFAIRKSAMYGDTKRTEAIFYTPQEIANIMVEMLIEQEGKTIYDPICNSGNFLIKANQEKKAKIFGEKENIEYYSIFKTRMLLREIKDKTIETTNMKFNYIILNPPFSQKNWKQRISHTEICQEYELSENAVADYAYVLTALERLEENGKMAVILPHGVLFRENERKVRKKLIEKNEIEAIIGLPENLFYDTRIPVVILILVKNRKDENVLFIDASHEFETKRGNHILVQKYQNKIVESYQKKKEIEGYSRLVTKEEIKEKDFNLTIKKYIRKKSKQNDIEQSQLIKQLKDLEDEKDILEENINDILTVLNVKVFQQENKEHTVNYELNSRQIGQNIKRARAKRNCTQEELGEKLLLSPRYISMMERGMRGMRLETLARICNVLKVSIEEMIK